MITIFILTSFSVLIFGQDYACCALGYSGPKFIDNSNKIYHLLDIVENKFHYDSHKKLSRIIRDSKSDSEFKVLIENGSTFRNILVLEKDKLTDKLIFSYNKDRNLSSIYYQNKVRKNRGFTEKVFSYDGLNISNINLNIEGWQTNESFVYIESDQLNTLINKKREINNSRFENEYQKMLCIN